jgi:capsular exopolysaccharide synthesis family protein
LEPHNDNTFSRTRYRALGAGISAVTLHDYLRIFRERWGVVLTALLLGLIVAASTWYMRPKEYTATLTMYVSAQTADSAQSAYQGAQLSQQRVTSYVELVASTRVTREVISNLGLAMSPEDLAEQIKASSTLDSVLVDVAVTDTSPQRAADIANSVGLMFSKLVTELERPTAPGAQPPVAVRVVQPAAVPLTQSSTSLPFSLALGLLSGLALGIGGALVRNALDTSVKSPDHLREASGAPNLGFIAFDPETPKRPLTVHEDPQSPRSEAFRQLRTNLQFVDVDHPRKIVIITSSLPEEGKSTTLANLAIAMASAGHRVLAIEADLRRPKLADLLGLDRTVGLTSVLAGRVSLRQAVQHWSGGVDVLASGPLPPNPSELLASQQMACLLSDLRNQYDAILIDTPPLLPVTDAAAVAPATEGVIVVCRYKNTKRDQLRSAIQALESVSAPVLGTIFTMVPKTGPRAYAQYYACYRTHLPTQRAPQMKVAPPPPSVNARINRQRQVGYQANATAHQRPAG